MGANGRQRDLNVKNGCFQGGMPPKNGPCIQHIGAKPLKMVKKVVVTAYEGFKTNFEKIAR